MRLLPCSHSRHRICRPDITQRLKSGLLPGPHFPPKRAGAWGTPKVQDFLLL
jgi:hypothetical protein